MFERATWPLRKLFWRIEERLVWPLADALRRRPRRARVRAPTRPAPVQAQVGEAEAASKPAAAPLKVSRRSASLRDVSIVLATVAAAAAAGIGIATLVDPSGEVGGNPEPARSAAGAVATPPKGAAAAEESGPATLQGVAPDFESSSNAGGSEASAEAGRQVSPIQGTNSKPSSIPPGVAGSAAAMKTARDFAGAFVLYEVGDFDKKVRKTFARTAIPALARALSDRPPRLPEGVQVPTAKVQNVVLGAERGREVDASVSLLRLGDLSELRLTLIQRKGGWAVREVRG